jgi:hypothetical protein
MQQYKLTRDWFGPDATLHYAGEVVSADPKVIPSGSLPWGPDGAEPAARGDAGAEGAGHRAPPAPSPVETIVPAPHRENEITDTSLPPDEPAAEPESPKGGKKGVSL